MGSCGRGLGRPGWWSACRGATGGCAVRGDHQPGEQREEQQREHGQRRDQERAADDLVVLVLRQAVHDVAAEAAEATITAAMVVVDTICTAPSAAR